MTTEVNLAKCVCGGCPHQMCRTDNGWFSTICGSCDAKTPYYILVAEANAAWNRMMATPETSLDCFKANQCGPARNLLSALEDGLQEAINSLPGAGAQTTLHPTTLALCAMRDVIHEVLAKTP